MATIITSECINCGACEAECPNTAIYQGGVEWELNGVTHLTLSTDIFFIVREKCTECVGFFDHEACAAVCPVDCCIPDPNNPESEDALLARARQLHADKNFGDGFPSRFRKAGAAKAAEPPVAQAPEAVPAAKAIAPDQPLATPPPAAEAPKMAAPPPAPKKPEPAAAHAPPKQPAPDTASTVSPTPAQASTAPSSGIPGVGYWDIPIECFRCNRIYSVSFRYFRSGAVLYCPSCHGSYVVTTSLYGHVSRAVRAFRARTHIERPTDLKELTAPQRQQVEAFEASLQQASREIRAPGAPRKRAGIFG